MAARARSTSTLDQENNALIALRAAGDAGMTTDQLRAIGLYQSSARLWGLRQRGYVISTELWDGVGADGLWHCRMARYRLISEPLPLDAKTARESLCAGAGAHEGGQTHVA